MRRSMRGGRDPTERLIFFSLIHLTQGFAHAPLSLTHSPRFVYIYINNCSHVQCLPLNEKRTSVVAVGVQVLRILRYQPGAPPFPLLEYFFFFSVGGKERKRKLKEANRGQRRLARAFGMFLMRWHLGIAGRCVCRCECTISFLVFFFFVSIVLLLFVCELFFDT